MLAAGNEGYLELQQGDEMLGVNTDLSIGDPANLDEAIAVGSIHKIEAAPVRHVVLQLARPDRRRPREARRRGARRADPVVPRAGANPATKLRNNLYVRDERHEHGRARTCRA